MACCRLPSSCVLCASPCLGASFFVLRIPGAAAKVPAGDLRTSAVLRASMDGATCLGLWEFVVATGAASFRLALDPVIVPGGTTVDHERQPRLRAVAPVLSKQSRAVARSCREVASPDEMV